MKKYLNYASFMKNDVKDWINVNLKNYLKKNPENQSEIEHILDYLDSNDRPPRIKFMSYPEAKNNAEKWVKKLKKRGNNIIETEQDIEVIYHYKSGDKLVKLISKSSYEREGNLMSNCVASYYGKNDCEIYSLRDLQNQPHCTIELFKRNNQINQIKGKGNGSIHPKYIKFVKIALEKLGVPIRLSEMQHLGYIELGTDYLKLMEQVYELKSIQFITMQGKRLFYENSKLIKKHN